MHCLINIFKTFFPLLLLLNGAMADDQNAQICLRPNQEVAPISKAGLKVVKSNQIASSDDMLDFALDRSVLAERRRSLVDDDLMNFPSINRLRIVPRSPSKFSFDLYFYGDHKEAILIEALDWRVFLHRLIPESGSPALNSIRRLHAHFSEYERRSVLFTRSSSEDAPVTNVAQLASWFKSMDATTLPVSTFTITNNCRAAGSYEYEWPGYIKGHFQLPLAFMHNLLQAYDQIYDCPTNQWQGIGVYGKGSAQTEIRYTKFYSKLFDIGIPSWRPKDILISLWSRFFEKDYQWYAVGDFSAVTHSIDLLLKQWPISAPWREVALTQESSGLIPYEQFTFETQMKSNYVRMLEALSYVQTPCDKNANQQLPRNLEVPEYWEQKSKENFWQQHPCLIIPMTYRYWEDLVNYPVHLSKFEVDGVYTGRALKHSFGKLGEYNEELMKESKHRMPFNFKNFITQYHRAELASDDEFLSLRLFNSQGPNFILANLPWNTLKQEYQGKRIESKFIRDYSFYELIRGVERLIGIETRPLSYQVNEVTDNKIEARPLYAWFYDAKTGMIMNHHDTTIGIEQWILRWHPAGKLILDFVSHERIVPIRRYYLECPQCASKIFD